MAVSIEEARYVARLARLALSDEELEALAAELSAVLEHFESLPGAEVADVSSRDRAVTDEGPTGGPGELRPDRVGELRPDRVGAMLSAAEALRNAPASEDGQFSVPGFLPDEP